MVAEVERDLLPSKLCEYIFELAGKFNQFYEACPVLTAETKELRDSRLALCELTASVLALNLRLLGIEPLERI
jgi:arginyl-tRNA synthetase